MSSAIAAIRPDMGDDVFHFIRGRNAEEAYNVLERILDERKLRGGTGMIKGGHRCVCFTETPPMFFARHFGRYRNGTSFQPFGIQLSKKWVLENGGRTVIYQPDDDYWKLAADQKYRHVRHEVLPDRIIDFTWEREWRIHTDVLELQPEHVKVVIHPEYEKLLWRWHDYEQSMYALQLNAAYGFDTGYEAERFPWHVEPLHYEERGYGYHK